MNDPSPALFDLSPIRGLMDAGFDLETEILPVIRSKTGGKARSWSYFVGAIRDSRDVRAAAANDVTAPRTGNRGPPGERQQSRPTRGVASALAGIEAVFGRDFDR